MKSKKHVAIVGHYYPDGTVSIKFDPPLTIKPNLSIFEEDEYDGEITCPQCGRDLDEIKDQRCPACNVPLDAKEIRDGLE